MSEEKKSLLDQKFEGDWNGVEEEFDKEECGVFSIDIPQDLFVLIEYDYSGSEKGNVIGVFCNPDYAKLYSKWLQKKHPISDFEIHKTRGNPPKETIENYD